MRFDHNLNSLRGVARSREEAHVAMRTMRTLGWLAMLSSAVAIAPSRPCVSRLARRPLLQNALALGVLAPSATNAAEKKPNLKEAVAQLSRKK